MGGAQPPLSSNASGRIHEGRKSNPGGNWFWSDTYPLRMERRRSAKAELIQVDCARSGSAEDRLPRSRGDKVSCTIQYSRLGLALGLGFHSIVHIGKGYPHPMGKYNAVMRVVLHLYVHPTRFFFCVYSEERGHRMVTSIEWVRVSHVLQDEEGGKPIKTFRPGARNGAAC